MKHLILICALLSYTLSGRIWACLDTVSAYISSGVRSANQRIDQIWNQGNNELYFSGYAWHNRYIYTREKIKHYNELAWGGGIGRGFWDEHGNWHGLYALAFLDSHSKLEPAAGYAYLKVTPWSYALKAGVGYSILATVRSDLNHGLPLPGILPWVSLFYKKITLAATYIPGFNHNGNVAYILGKYTL